MANRDDVRAVIAARLKATGAKDPHGSVAAVAEDAVVFDLPPPLAQPAEEIRDTARAQSWFDTWDGPISIDLRKLVVRAEGLAVMIAISISRR